MREILKESVQKLDITIWLITLLFFISSALIMGGNVLNSLFGALGVVTLMFFIGLSIELILSAIKNVKGLGTVTGFITNGPEALVLIVGLMSGNVLFAASTPLGSNVMNPVLLIVGIFATGMLVKIKKFKYNTFFSVSFIITAILATIFFKIPESYYIYWIATSLAISIYMFTRKFDNPNHEKEIDEEPVSKLFLPLGMLMLLGAGYFLDPIVNFTADSSLAPKGVIGFLVLATLTSWPEFKSVLGLLKRNKIQDSFMNILVSNITNLWLAIAGVLVWMFIK